MDFFDRIKDAVKAKGMTIEGLLADTFGEEVSRGTYNNWRRRNNLPRADYAVQIAKSLGVSVEYLVTGDDPKFSEMAPLRRDFHRWIDELEEEELKDLDSYFNLLEVGAIVTSLRNKKEGA